MEQSNEYIEICKSCMNIENYYFKKRIDSILLQLDPAISNKYNLYLSQIKNLINDCLKGLSTEEFDKRDSQIRIPVQRDLILSTGN